MARHEQRLDELAKEERQLINERDSAKAKAMADHKAADEKLKQLAAGQQKELDQAVDAVLAKQMYMIVTGHETLRPGVPNDYRIEIKNMKGEPELAASTSPSATSPATKLSSTRRTWPVMGPTPCPCRPTCRCDPAIRWRWKW